MRIQSKQSRRVSPQIQPLIIHGQNKENHNKSKSGTRITNTNPISPFKIKSTDSNLPTAITTHHLSFSLFLSLQFSSSPSFSPISIHIQVHFLWTMDGPLSSYSSFLIHISSNVESEERMEPPIQTEYLRSGGAMILMVIESGASALTSFCTLSQYKRHVWYT